jgi:hypothetical protein
MRWTVAVQSTLASTMEGRGAPAELPGFYFDQEKNRYFPISSRPTRSAPAPEHKAESSTAAGKRTVGQSYPRSSGRREVLLPNAYARGRHISYNS